MPQKTSPFGLSRRRFLRLAALAATFSLTGKISGAVSTDPGGNAKIVWDEKTKTFVTTGTYARVKRLASGTLALVYATGGNLFIRLKARGQKKWGGAVLVARDESRRHNYTNAELVEIPGKGLLYLWNARPRNGVVLPYKIMAKISRDGGKNWGVEKTLYSGGDTFETGCWEPAGVALPNGEVQLFFADETDMPGTDQNIKMLRSTDGAKTWSPPRIVAYRKGRRDGMPVPFFLEKKRAVGLSIEDNGLGPNGASALQPAVIFAPNGTAWGDEVIGGDSQHRRAALRSDAQLPPEIYAGAPYLITLQNGTATVLSVQSAERRAPSNTHTHAVMKVYVGDANAQNFANPTTPFPDLPPNAAALWNSVCEIDGNGTVLAVASITGLPGKNGIWTIEGRLVK